MNRAFRDRIYRKWKKFAPERWWGDFVDIRFFLLEKLGELKGKDILDLGSNIGIIACEMARTGNRVVGLDTEREALATYREVFAAEGLEPLAVCGSMEALPFATPAFDVVLLGWSFCYLENDERKSKALEQMKLLLRPGGEVYFVEANRECYIQGRGRAFLWTVEEAPRFFKSRGFTIEDVVGWNPLPSLLFWLPLKLKMALPQKFVLCFYPPGRLLRFVPGWYGFFRWLGYHSFARKYCRSYFIRAIKG